MQVEQKSNLVQELEILVGGGTPLSCSRHRLQVFCDLPAREHHVQVKCPWNNETINVPLDFTSPLSANMRLHTARKRKFVQLVVCGQSSTKIKLDKPTLRSETSGVVFQDLNPMIDHQKSVSKKGLIYLSSLAHNVTYATVFRSILVWNTQTSPTDQLFVPHDLTTVLYSTLTFSTISSASPLSSVLSNLSPLLY